MNLTERLENEGQLLKDWRIKSVIVMKSGQLAGQWHERGSDQLGPLYSCTKSVLSALIGIALDRKEIGGVDIPLSYYFSGGNVTGGRSLDGITIQHLLTMTPGFEWPDFDKPYKALRKASDHIAFAWSRPIIHEPGTAFTYNSGGSLLLSAILTKETGKSALQYAKEHLFEPLRFRAARWSERDGISEGGTGLFLFGLDLAKLGVLYNSGGRWQGMRLLSEKWVRQSTKLHHRGLLQYEPPIYGGYGYHWWISPADHNGCADCYFAYGHGGQYLLVMPEHDLTIVVRKQITKRNEGIYSRRLIFEHIVPFFSSFGRGELE